MVMFANAQMDITMITVVFHVIIVAILAVIALSLTAQLVLQLTKELWILLLASVYARVVLCKMEVLSAKVAMLPASLAISTLPLAHLVTAKQEGF